MRNIIIIAFVCCFMIISVTCQDELKWKNEVEKLSEADYDNPKGLETIVLTGSSSARMWKDIGKRIPDYFFHNNGFGGSQMHELEFYLDELVLKFKPSKVIIYEGDNDISSGKSTDTILESTKRIVTKIKQELPDSEIYFISPKPSLARWELKNQYLELNNTLKAYCETNKGVHFIDVWEVMLNEEGRPIEHIFLEDGLHMNEQGYDIWEAQVRKKLGL